MPAEALVVVADAHLAAPRPGAGPSPAEARLLAFLERVPDLGDALLVNGDLFDFWFGYRRAIPRHGFRVAAALARLTARVPVTLVGGNHDRWDRGFWRDDLGLAFAPRRATLAVGARRVLAVHGDGLTDRSATGRLAHRLVSLPVTSALFGLLPPDLGFPLVERLAPWLGDGHASAAEMERAAARQRAWAEATLEHDPSLGCLVMAHTHCPALVDFADGRQYLNPGAWFDGGRYAVVTERGAALRRFEA
ncbi:MAG TPA: metallophosphoesterase [Gemmatimonadales bacterium]|nr:metallophosphoesterase [Gemmatimonadales bacterium]